MCVKRVLIAEKSVHNESNEKDRSGIAWQKPLLVHPASSRWIWPKFGVDIRNSLKNVVVILEQTKRTGKRSNRPPNLRWAEIGRGQNSAKESRRSIDGRGAKKRILQCI